MGKKNVGVVELYMLFYNVISTLGWGNVLLSRGEVKQIQTVALLELAHILVGMTRSSLPTAAAQVASRLFMVWFICEGFPSVKDNWAYQSMLYAVYLFDLVEHH
jgi:hypothetical protein